jgi:hypothetical protein
MGPLRSDVTAAEGVNLYEMPDFDLMRETDGVELMEAVDEWLATRLEELRLQRREGDHDRHR